MYMYVQLAAEQRAVFHIPVKYYRTLEGLRINIPLAHVYLD